MGNDEKIFKILRKNLDPFRTNFFPGMPLKSKKTGSSPVQTIPSSAVYKHSSSHGKSLEDNLRVVSEALAQDGKGLTLFLNAPKEILKESSIQRLPSQRKVISYF